MHDTSYDTSTMTSLTGLVLSFADKDDHVGQSINTL
jgi:hypothetical protein